MDTNKEKSVDEIVMDNADNTNTTDKNRGESGSAMMSGISGRNNVIRKKQTKSPPCSKCQQLKIDNVVSKSFTCPKCHKITYKT